MIGEFRMNDFNSVPYKLVGLDVWLSHKGNKATSYDECRVQSAIDFAIENAVLREGIGIIKCGDNVFEYRSAIYEPRENNGFSGNQVVVFFGDFVLRGKQREIGVADDSNQEIAIIK
jgi:hypothetical protein